MSQSYSSTQNVTNDVLQSSLAKCVNTCDNLRENLLISLTGVNIGDIDASQSCEVYGTTCILKTQLDDSIDNILSSISKQSQFKASDPFSFEFSNFSQDININQTIRNRVSQLMSSTCENAAGNVDINPTFIATGSSIGAFNISQNGTVSNTECNINNVAKNTITNDETAKGDQSQTEFGWLGILLLIIVVICIAVVLVYLFKYLIAIEGKTEDIQISSGPQVGRQYLSPSLNRSIEEEMAESSAKAAYHNERASQYKSMFDRRKSPSRTTGLNPADTSTTKNTTTNTQSSDKEEIPVPQGAGDIPMDTFNTNVNSESGEPVGEGGGGETSF